MPKKETKDTSKNDAVVLKGKDLLKNTGFLSGLWFSSQEKEEAKEKDTKKEDSDVKTTSVAPKKDTVVASVDDFAALRPKTTTPSRPRPTPSRAKPQHGWRQRAPQHGGHQKKPQHGWYQKPQGYDPRRGGKFKAKPAPTPFSKKPKVAKTSATLVKKESITMWEWLSVKEFAEKMGISHLEVMKKLLENKIMVSINSSIDFETASLIAEEFNVTVVQEQATLNVESFMLGDLQSVLEVDKTAENKALRPPIVTVMWHVDHGKTSLLDYLRKTNVAGGEAGGITQSIGASVIVHKDQRITFIDTPWHELFTTLRARGAKLTNVAVIVIAADDGIMPQTVESIDHAKAAWVPIIIAVTKIDKPQNNFEKIKTDLGRHEIVPEDWGWDVPVIGVSSMTGQGIDDLLEAILLHSEMLELQYNPDRAAVGVVLDAYKDARQWVVSSVIVLTGTLKVWDVIVAYNTYGKVKRMQDWKGKVVKKVQWWEPVQILWLSELPEPGRMVEVVTKEKDAQKRVSHIENEALMEQQVSTVDQFLQDLQWSEKTELRLILKAEWSSSLDALQQAVETVQTPDNVTIKVIRSDVGQFTESDLSLAQASNALVLWFDVATPAILKKKAQAIQVEMKSFAIIYELTDYLTQLTLGMLKKEYEETFIGSLNVLGIFFRKWKEMVIWGKVSEWHVRNGATFKVMRYENEELVEIASGKVTSLQKDQTNVKEMAKWHECGMKVRVGKKVEVWDKLEFYEMQEKKVEKKTEKESQKATEESTEKEVSEGAKEDGAV